MNNPYLPTRTPSRDFLAAWADYERTNARAAEQYDRLPLAAFHHAPASHCTDCRGWTYDRERRCWACRGIGRRAG